MKFFDNVDTSTQTIIGICIAVIIVAILLGICTALLRRARNKAQIKKAGNRGEKLVSLATMKVLREGDVMLRNVTLSYEGKETEIDEVIVNRRGIFIIEVKNYNGRIRGNVDDYEWTKTKVSPGGNVFEKKVRNPIKQVKRQVYILSQVLKSHGLHVWIEGYVVFTKNNSPVTDPMVLWRKSDIDRVIHHGNDYQLSQETMKQVIQCLK